jgi:hypothetical protein
MTMGSSKIAGKNGPGTGFLIKGSGAFMTSGPHFDATKERYKWARVAWAVTISSDTQTL